MDFSIISVTTDVILAAACNHPEKIGSHSQSLGGQKKIGSIGNRNHRYFFTPSMAQIKLVPVPNLSMLGLCE